MTNAVVSMPMANVSNQSLDNLLRALAQGWKIQAPVYWRKQWFTGRGDKIGYYFILKRDAETDLLIVPDDEKVRQLIELQRIKVIVA